MLSAYEGTKAFLQQLPDWALTLVACVQLSEEAENGEFASSAVRNRAGLRVVILVDLCKFGILERTGDSIRGGRNAVYRMPDREGVKRALIEMGINPEQRLPGDGFNLKHRPTL